MYKNKLKFSHQTDMLKNGEKRWINERKIKY